MLSKIIAFVGAGGKTSSIYSYASFLKSQNKKVVITTTTHMQYPNENFLPLCTTAEQAKVNLLNTNKITVCAVDAGVINNVHKIQTLPIEEFVKCKEICDFMLVEADGAKCLPLKAPAMHEPQIPDDCDTVVICAGLDSLYKPISQVCFRQEEVRKILSCRQNKKITEDHIITEFDVATILFYGYILPLIKNNIAKSFCVLLNKKDTVKNVESCKKIDLLINDWTNALNSSINKFATKILSLYNEDFIL